MKNNFNTALILIIVALLLAVSYSYAQDEGPPPLPFFNIRPTPTILTCSPSYQFVDTNATVNVSAAGGNLTYLWSAPGGTPARGSGRIFGTKYSTAGIKRITTVSGGQYATCIANVSSVAAAPTITLQPPSDASQTPPSISELPPTLPGITPSSTTSTPPATISGQELIAISSRLDDLRFNMEGFKKKSDAVSDFFRSQGDLQAAQKFSAAAGIFSEIMQEIDKTQAVTQSRDASAIRQYVKNLVVFSRPRIGEAQSLILNSDKSALKQCKVTGCSGEICSDEDVITTCEFRPEYACYRAARCERQADGRCDWAQTQELMSCLGGLTKGVTFSIEEGKMQKITLEGYEHTFSLDIIISTDKILLTLDGVQDSALYGEPKHIGNVILVVDDISLTSAGKRSVITIYVTG